MGRSPKRARAKPKAKASSASGSQGSAAASSCGRQLRRLTTDQEAKQKLRDNFKGWSKEDLMVRRVDDSTVFDSVKEGIRRKRKDRTFTLGPNFYGPIKEKFRPSSSAIAQLKVPDSNTDAVNPKMMKAMAATRTQKPDREPMRLYLASSKTCNLRELVGILRWALALNRLASTQMQCVPVILTWMVDVKLQTAYQEMYAIVRPWIDQSLQAVYKEAGRPEVLKWAALKRDILGLALPLAALDRVLAMAPDWVAVTNELNEVVSSSDVGFMLFGFACVQNLAAVVKKAIMDAIQELAGKVLTKTMLDDLKNQVLEKVEAVPNVALLQSSRQIEFAYGSVDLSRVISSLGQEVRLRIDSAWKAVAVFTGKGSKLWCEEVLAPDGLMQAAPFQVEADACQAMNFTRDRCDKVFKASGIDSGDLVKATVTANSAEWLMNDDAFLVEISMLDFVSGEGSEVRLLQAAIKHLPSLDESKDPALSLQAVQQLQRGKLHDLGSTPAQAKLALVGTWLSRVVEARALDFSQVDDKDLLLATCKTRMQYFCEHQEAAAADDEFEDGGILRGPAAAKAKLQAVQAKVEGTRELKDVEFLKRWGYLLSSEDQAAAKEIEQALNSKQPVRLSKRGAAKPRSKRNQAMEEAAAMFR